MEAKNTSKDKDFYMVLRNRPYERQLNQEELERE